MAKAPITGGDPGLAKPSLCHAAAGALSLDDYEWLGK